MEIEKYVPDGPYVFKSGKRERKVAELLMFKDYGFLRWYLWKLNSVMGGKMSPFHLHLNWLIHQGENRAAKALCQECGHESPIRIFSVLGNDRYGYSIGLPYACCGRPECKENLEAQALGKSIFLPLKFSSIIRFQNKSDQQSVVRLLKRAHELPSRLTKEIAFRFFSEP